MGRGQNSGNASSAADILYGDVGVRGQEAAVQLTSEDKAQSTRGLKLLRLVAKERHQPTLPDVIHLTTKLLDPDPQLITKDGRHLPTGEMVDTHNELIKLEEKGCVERVQVEGGMTGLYSLTPKGKAVLEEFQLMPS